MPCTRKTGQHSLDLPSTFSRLTLRVLKQETLTGCDAQLDASDVLGVRAVRSGRNRGRTEETKQPKARLRRMPTCCQDEHPENVPVLLGMDVRVAWRDKKVVAAILVLAVEWSR